MRNLRADAERGNVQEESVNATRQMHHANIYTSCRRTARQRTRRRHRVTRDSR
jgi:hypothetical protein